MQRMTTALALVAFFDGSSNRFLSAVNSARSSTSGGLELEVRD
jgi:hypothetical protein